MEATTTIEPNLAVAKNTLQRSRRHFFDALDGRTRSPSTELLRAARGIRSALADGLDIGDLALMPAEGRLKPGEAVVWRAVAEVIQKLASSEIPL